MELYLKARRALVTGATAGIGRQIALTLASEGVDLAVVGRRRVLLEEVAREAAASYAVNVVIVEIDMMDTDAPRQAAALAIEGLGSIDILVNCMGASRKVALDATDEVWEATMTLNWTRHRQLTGEILPKMQEVGWGRVINITGTNETTGLNAAVVAKAAMHAWAKGLSDLVARDGITVNCLAPGRIDSEQLRRLYTPERRDAAANAEIPLGRFGDPRELADLATFLASPRASYVTGAVIHVDGGARRYMY